MSLENACSPSFRHYTRGGADNYYKFRLEFRHSAYHEVWAANFTGGKTIEKKIEPDH